AQPGALPVDVNPARDRSDIERPDSVLDELEDPLMRDERVAVRDNGEHLAAIVTDDSLSFGNRRVPVLVGLVDRAERHGEVGEVAPGDVLVEVTREVDRRAWHAVLLV